MSTKIYDAYRIKEGFIIDDLMKKILLSKERYMDGVVSVINRMYPDLSTYGKGNVEDKIRIVMSSGLSDPLNFSASCVVYFNKGRMYIQFFGLGYPVEEKVVLGVFDGMLEDYHYQNQSDAWYDYDETLTEDEKEVHAKEYKIRGVTWDEIIGERYRSCESGLSFDFFHRDDIFQVVYKTYDTQLKQKGNDNDKQNS